jgi:inosose dehydratase
MLPAERVLGEMAQLGLRGTELGAPGFLPTQPDELQAMLARHRLELVGGFVPLVLHRPELGEACNQARVAAELLSRCGAEIFVLALVEDLDWSPPCGLDLSEWQNLAQNVARVVALAGEYKLTVALHPHAGTLIETAEQIEQALNHLDVPWCLDPGHMVIAGADPVAFARAHADQIAHVHLKDVDARLAEAVRDGRLSLLEATRRGLFMPLGKGDARIAEVIEALDRHGYERWFVLEQDTAITGEEPTVGSGPMLNVKESIAFLLNSAPTTQEVS